MSKVLLYQKRKSDMPNELLINQPIYSGGEGIIYFDNGNKYAVKLYHRDKVGSEKRRLLEMVTLLGNNLTPEEEQFLCWPLALVRTVNNVEQIGCVTKRIPMPPFTELYQMTLTPREAAKQFRLGRSWSHYLQIARGIARSVAVLNGKGCAHADLHYRNFLVNPDTCDVILLDLDGLMVSGFLPPAVAGLWGFMAPEIVDGKLPDLLSDRHSLAVEILQTLLFRNVFEPLISYDPNNEDNDAKFGWGKEARFSEDPKDRRNRPKALAMPLFRGGALSYKMLTPALQRLTERACLDGLRDPPKRPSAQEWINTLSYALDELYRCKFCRQHFPYPHWLLPIVRRSCPFCGQHVSDPLPSVLKLYDPRHKGSYFFTQRYLVMENNWQLFADVLDPQRNPPMSRKMEAKVGHVELNNKEKTNYLVNDEDNTWQIQPGDKGNVFKVKKNDAVPLKRGTIIYFGENKRLLAIQE